MKGAGTPRDSAGRFEEHTRCEFCGQPIRGDYWSDPDLPRVADGDTTSHAARARAALTEVP